MIRAVFALDERRNATAIPPASVSATRRTTRESSSRPNGDATSSCRAGVAPAGVRRPTLFEPELPSIFPMFATTDSGDEDPAFA